MEKDKESDSKKGVSGSVSQGEKAKDEKDTSSDTKKKEADDDDQPSIPLTPLQQTYKRIIENIELYHRGVLLKENRYYLRVIRNTFVPSIRRSINKPILYTLIQDLYPELQTWLDRAAPPSNAATSSITSSTSTSAKDTAKDAMEVEEKDGGVEKKDDEYEILSLKRVFTTPVQQQLEEESKAKAGAGGEEKQFTPPTPSLTDDDARRSLQVDSKVEIHAYIHLLLVVFLLDTRTNDELAAECVSELVQYVHQYNRRSLDWLSSKIYYYYDLAYSRINQLDSIRSTLLHAHRTATLQHNEPGQAALTVSILRNYLHYNLYAAADTFRLKSTFPEERSNNLLARYLYYAGRIEAIQLHYSNAYNHLSQALRKAPQKKGVAVGFRLQVTKLYIIIQLLIGDIPDKSLFSTSDLQQLLIPYYDLTKAVRIGDLESFNLIVNRYKSVFEDDALISFIIRLRNNVIKTGLRKISLAYSRITLSDIAKKLGLESVEDCEYVVVKAISDGVIDARVDHSTGTVISRETCDIYRSNEPQQQFHKRITFCLDLHNEAVKAMRFPSNLNKLLALTEAGFDADEDEDEENAASRAAVQAAEKKSKEDGNPKK